MRPAQERVRAGRLDSSRAGCFQFQKRSLEHPNSGPSSDYRFSEDNLIRSFFLFPKEGKVQICL